MLIEGDTELLRTLPYVIPVHGCRKGFVLHLLLHRRCLDVGNLLRGADKGDRNDETGELIDCVEGFCHGAFPRDTGVISVSKNCCGPFGGIAPLLQYLNTLKGMVLETRVSFIVKVVDQAHDTPQLHVLAILLRIIPHGGLNGKGVFDEPLLGRVLGQKFPCLFPANRHTAPPLSP